MADDLTAEEIRTLLRLKPNATCGFVRETYLNKLSITPGGLRAIRGWSVARLRGLLHDVIGRDRDFGRRQFCTIVIK
jgi:hypothetical protein